ncbi:Uncharacterised protein [Mycobacteroides abscessus subsp. abscessus]|nr:Uncharacterised protein [Mycobacteroides abscessus subsp. abscessus]
MPAVPDLRHLIDGESDIDGSLTDGQVTVVAEAARNPLRQRFGLSFHLGLADDERSACIRLRRNQGPGEGLQQPGDDGLVCLRLPLGGLVLLILSEVQVGLVCQDVRPTQIVAGGVVEFFESGFVCGEVHQHVAVGAVGGAALLGGLSREFLG